jgi:hypothetical protein
MNKFKKEKEIEETMKRCFMTGLLVSVIPAMALVVDFEELTLNENTFGPVLTGTTQYIPVSADFDSGGVTFQHIFTDFGGGWSSWEGFVYSTMRDTQTVSHNNQYSAVTGRGVDDSSVYAVGYISADYNTGQLIPVHATLQTPARISGAYFTNTTYTHGVMKDGIVTEYFAVDPFGESDYLKLIITGLDGYGQQTGTVEFYLGRGLSIVDDWVWVNLYDLGTVSQIAFTVEGTDYSWGFLNTPSYFAVDNLTYIIPEPATLVLLGLGIMGLRRGKN